MWDGGKTKKRMCGHKLPTRQPFSRAFPVAIVNSASIHVGQESHFGRLPNWLGGGMSRPGKLHSREQPPLTWQGTSYACSDVELLAVP